jgi:hypothetical protein
MKAVQMLLLSAFAWAVLSGCSAPQYEYKPLYQVKPEKEKLNDGE